MRAAVHLAAALARAALAFAVGRWLRDPSPGGPFLILLGAVILWVGAVRRLYRPGGLGRAPAPDRRGARPPVLTARSATSCGWPGSGRAGCADSGRG